MLKLIIAAILTAVLGHFFILATFSHTDRTEAQWPSKGHISPLHAFSTLRESTTWRTDFSLDVPASGRMHDTHEMKAQKTQILGAHKRTSAVFIFTKCSFYTFSLYSILYTMWTCVKNPILGLVSKKPYLVKNLFEIIFIFRPKGEGVGSAKPPDPSPLRGRW